MQRDTNPDPWIDYQKILSFKDRDENSEIYANMFQRLMTPYRDR